MKVGIVIITYNISSELFCLQIEAIRKFCKDDFEIIVVDNSSDPEKSTGIEYHAGQLNLLYRRTFASSVNGSESHVFAANFSYQRLKNIYEYFAYFDHDLIPLYDFSIKEILGEDKIMAGLGQQKNGKKYFWQGCVCFANNRIDKDLVDFSTNAEFGLDSGGNLYKIIEKYGEEYCVFFNEEYQQNPYFLSHNYGYYALINNKMFLHCVAASNWVGIQGNEERINTLINIIKEKIRDVE